MKHIKTRSGSTFEKRNGSMPLWMAAATFGIYFLICFGLTLPYHYSNTDIILYSSVLPEILDVLTDLLETAVFSFAFSFLIYSVFKKGNRSTTIGLFSIFLGAVLFRRICELIVILIVFKSLSANDFITSAASLLLEWLMVGGIVLLIHVCANKHYRDAALSRKKSMLFSDDEIEPNRSFFYPFKKIYSKQNSVQHCLMLIGIILSAVRIASRIIFDIFYTVENGFPSDAVEILKEIGTMAIYYSSDILIGILFYVSSILILSRLYRKE